MLKEVASLVVGSRLWGTDYEASDEEILSITYPTEHELYLGHHPLSIVVTKDTGTETTWSTLRFHSLVRSFNPDALAIMLALSEDTATCEDNYRALLRLYSVILQDPATLEKIKFIVASAARNRVLNELRKPLTSKSVINIAYLAEMLNYAHSGSFNKIADYVYNFAVLVGKDSLFTRADYVALVEARATGAVLEHYVNRSKEYVIQNEYTKPFSLETEIHDTQVRLDAAYLEYIKSTG